MDVGPIVREVHIQRGTHFNLSGGKRAQRGRALMPDALFPRIEFQLPAQTLLPVAQAKRRY